MQTGDATTSPQVKTNVLRLLEGAQLPFRWYEYEVTDGKLDALSLAAQIGEPPEQVFKTLVTCGATPRTYFVFVIPGNQELDLKKAAKAAGEKSVAMLHVSQLLDLTGYVRGGCSPVGMKKQFPTFYHVSCLGLDTMAVSAGKIGAQAELAPADLIRLTRGQTADLIVSD